MWRRYRNAKHVVVPVLLAAGLWLMRGEPQPTPRWTAGIVLAAVLTLAYLVEEIVWMRIGKGRPCPNCGAMLPVRSFHLALLCPKCHKPV